jgi:hypothetical protein
VLAVLAVPACTKPGAQTTVVLVGSGGKALIERVAWAELALKPPLPRNDAVTVWLPAWLGANVTVQLDWPVPLGFIAQSVLGWNGPALSEEKLTVPVGLLGVAEVSVTVAPQVVVAWTCSDVGEQRIAIVVGSGGLTPTTNVV